MKKIIFVAAVAAAAFCMTGCSKEEPSALDQVKDKAAETAKAADKTAHAGAAHHVNRHPYLLEKFEHADVRSALCATAAEDQCDGRPVLVAVNAVHACPHVPDHRAVHGRMHAVRRKTVGVCLSLDCHAADNGED